MCLVLVGRRGLGDEGVVAQRSRNEEAKGLAVDPPTGGQFLHRGGKQNRPEARLGNAQGRREVHDSEGAELRYRKRCLNCKKSAEKQKNIMQIRT